MKKLYLKDILRESGCPDTPFKANPLIKNVVTRSDRVKDHTIFFDVNKKSTTDFKPYQKYQCSFAITEDAEKFTGISPNLKVIKIPDINKAYENFIRYYRSLFDIPVIGITGTCGKTTVKEMTTHILSKSYNVHSTHKSENALILNHHYLMGLNDETQVGVFEMGVGWPGNIKTSCEYFRPNIGIITNIGVHHLLGCKTPENYIKAKEELLEGLDYKGTLILNSDDRNIKKLDLSPYQGKIIYFGLCKKAHYRASEIRYANEGMKFNLRYENEKYRVYVPGYGTHNIYNALAAITAAHTIGINLKEAVESIASFQHLNSHLNLHQGIKGCTVLDDTWNTNYLSTKAALKVLNRLGKKKKRIAVLGEMTQFADYSTLFHEKVGSEVVRTGVDVLITLGEKAIPIGEKALKKGMSKNNVYFCDNISEVQEILENILNNKCIVLLKDNHDSLKKILENIIDEN